MIAVCLLTADRFAYTATTLRTFTATNDLERFTLLHADDASTDPRVPALAQACGFETVAATSRRVGWLDMRIRLFGAAARRRAEWVVYLENDIEWIRAFPWPLFDFLRREAPTVYCLRLQGAYKDRAGLDACMTYHKDDRRRPVKWKPIKRAPEPAEVGWIHWSAQPSATRTTPLLRHHQYGWASRDLTARVVDNVAYHIGAERTGPRLKPARLEVEAYG